MTPPPEQPSWQDFPCPLEQCYYDVRLKSGELLTHVHPTNYGELFKPATGFIAHWRVEAVRLSAEPYPKRL